MSGPKVLVERIDQVTVLTINRPEVLNAIDSEVSQRLSNALAEFEADDGQQVAILTGAGDRAFCVGADLKELRAQQQAEQAAASGSGHAVEGGFGGITQRQLIKPILGAINGLALGGGAEIALALDLLVAADHASFGLPEVKRGLAAGVGGLLRLPRQVPLKIAMQMALVGEPLSAVEAYRLGLVNAVVGQDTLIATTMAMARSICANAPLAVRASKAVIAEGLNHPLYPGSSAWDVNARWVDSLAETEDAREGVAAFTEKRRAVWRGR